METRLTDLILLSYMFTSFYFLQAKQILIMTKNHLRKCKQKLEKLQVNFQKRYKDSKSFKFSYLYFLNTFVCGKIKYVFPISEILQAKRSPKEMDLLELK